MPSRAPTNQPTLNLNPKTYTMSEEIMPTNAEITDDQLEEVSGGLFDNNSCNALIKATVNVG
jgi:hypothetical protein